MVPALDTSASSCSTWLRYFTLGHVAKKMRQTDSKRKIKFGAKHVDYLQTSNGDGGGDGI